MGRRGGKRHLKKREKGSNLDLWSRIYLGEINVRIGHRKERGTRQQ